MPETLSEIRTRLWTTLARATADRRHPWRQPILATISAERTPTARVVVLRSVDQGAQRLTIYTDRRSAKVAEITAQPAVALTFWDPGTRWQLRATGTAEIIPDAARWWSLPEGGRGDYGNQPAPGAAMTDPYARHAATTPEEAAAAFCRLEVHLARLDWLTLATNPHRRAWFDATGAGGWLAP